MSKLLPRHEWFKNRVKEIISEIAALDAMDDWTKYREKTHEFANELLWAVTSWENCYSKKKVENG